MGTALMSVLAAGGGGLGAGAWLMLAFGCVALYGGLAFGIIRAIRGRLPYPDAVLEKAADAGWLVALGTLAVIWYVASLIQETGTRVHTIVWVLIYLLVCVPLAILCRHLIIAHYKRRQAQHEPPDA